MNRRRSRTLHNLVCLCLVLSGALVAWTGETRGAVEVFGQRTVADALSRAVTLFGIDDAGPEAEKLLLDVIRRADVTTADGVTARYYLGRLYHRNYYMLRQRNGLDLAAKRYVEVHNKLISTERGGAWYAEARFYKSLAYLELGKWKDVPEAIDHLEPPLDPELNIDYLVWSKDKRVINRRLQTATFRTQYLALLKDLKIDAGKAAGPDPKAVSAVLIGLQRLLEPAAKGRTAIFIKP